MKSFAAQLVILASCLNVFALSVRSVPQAVANECSSAQEVSSSVISVNGLDIVRQVFDCPDGNFTSASVGSSNVRILNSRSLLEERSQSECTTPNPECQCGASVECGCFEENTAPSSSDCSSLLGSTPIIASLQGPTFSIPSNQVHALSLRTCTIAVVNLASTTTEYCWDDLSSSLNSVMSCMNEASFANAVCLALDQRFVSRLGRSQ
ncbi:uncharacterized protein FOMMEDRAFT_137555 [Fomitiporia mediterranea MF3/22]|uniref:Uncharacterized protein n=1 Tax=Fomitiporia mediterranea (strain MF3/22) TaxID=694068 RepID=R7SG24_FOMME|nr:uncharacterized protein FOMMEDRAFT_137555 [Fomitiporia mediterranea MF3/22]EJC97663.1 hypothetical protein FOMMEDRAFT_137555 [Fomitiporia mediterranea MF3/22]